MSAEKMIKNEARSMLSGKWVTAVMAVMVLLFLPMVTALILMAAYAVLGESEVVTVFTSEPIKALLFALLHAAAVAALVLLSPVFAGFVRFFSKIACGEQAELGDVFYWFETSHRYKSAAAFLSLLLVKCLGIAIVCEAPALAVAFASDGDEIMLHVAVALAVAGLLGAFVWFHRFSFQMMLFSYYGYDGVTAAQLGAAAAKSGTWKLVKLSVSFIPWLLLNILVVPFLYLYPYMSCAYFVSTKYLLSDILAMKAKEEESTDNTAPAAVPAVDNTPAGEPADVTTDTAASENAETTAAQVNDAGDAEEKKAAETNADEEPESDTEAAKGENDAPAKLTLDKE